MDTGADGTVVSDEEPWLREVKVDKTTTVLHEPGGNELDILGTFRAQLSFKKNTHQKTVYVIKNQSTSLLSRNACTALKLVTCHVGEPSVNETSLTEDVLTEFLMLFQGLGLLKGYTYQISLKANAQPMCIYAPRKIPHPLREEAKDQLQDMVKQGVISAITQATEWCSGLVTVQKLSGGVRVCVDLTALNAAVKREVHPMATVEERWSQLENSKIYSKLDANSGFWQINLDEESMKLTTFLSPFGRFVFNRLPFRVSSAPKIFQRARSRVLEGIDGVICHMDDILVHGRDVEEHDRVIHKVLQTLQNSGLTLNRSKCEFRKDRLKFLGHIIDHDGEKPDQTLYMEKIIRGN